jgi:hypothetical protein
MWPRHQVWQRSTQHGGPRGRQHASTVALIQASFCDILLPPNVRSYAPMHNTKTPQYMTAGEPMVAALESRTPACCASLASNECCSVGNCQGHDEPIVDEV